MLNIKKFKKSLLDIHNTMTDSEDTIEEIVERRTKNTDISNFLEEFLKEFDNFEKQSLDHELMVK